MKKGATPRLQKKWLVGERPKELKWADLEKALDRYEKASAAFSKSPSESGGAATLDSLKAVSTGASKAVKECDAKKHKIEVDVLKKYAALCKAEEKAVADRLKQLEAEKDKGDDDDDVSDDELFDPVLLKKTIRRVTRKPYLFGFAVSPKVEDCVLVLKKTGSPKKLLKAVREETGTTKATCGVARQDPASPETLLLEIEGTQVAGTGKMCTRYLKVNRLLPFKKVRLMVGGEEVEDLADPDAPDDDDVDTDVAADTGGAAVASGAGSDPAENKDPKANKDAKKKVENEDLDALKEAVATLKQSGYPNVAVLVKKLDELEDAMGSLLWLVAQPALALVKKLIERALKDWTKQLQAEFNKKAKEAVEALKELKELSDQRKKDGKDNAKQEADYKKHKKTLETLVKSKQAYTEKTPLVEALIKDIGVAKLDPADPTTGPKMIKAIEERFNVTVDFKQDPAKEGETLQRLYEVMTIAPKFPASHLKKVEVDLKPKTARGEGAWYSPGGHSMGIETKRPKDSMDYSQQLGSARYFPDPVDADCQPANNDPVNYFDWATLHEVGHALDAKHKFMDTKQSNEKYGGWTEYNGKHEPIAKTVAARFAKDHSLDAATTTALEKYTLAVINKTAPAAAANADETAARKDVDDWYKTVNEAGALWWDGSGSKKYQFGGIVYQEAYAGQWVSYQYAARQKGIHGYQFRAPGEWFAELYAAYYSKKLKDSHPFVPDLKKLEAA